MYDYLNHCFSESDYVLYGTLFETSSLLPSFSCLHTHICGLASQASSVSHVTSQRSRCRTGRRIANSSPPWWGPGCISPQLFFSSLYFANTPVHMHPSIPSSLSSALTVIWLLLFSYKQRSDRRAPSSNSPPQVNEAGDSHPNDS